MTQVIGYTRRSREHDNGTYGLDDQEQRIRAWAEYKSLILSDVLREDDVSGATAPDARPLLGPALKGLRKGDVLVVAKFDRLSRSLFDFAGLIRRSQSEGWALVCLDPELDLTTASGRAMAGMLAVFAQFEKEQLVERLAGGKRAKARAGGYVGGNRLQRRYGYHLTEAPEGREYVPDPGEQETIAEMQRLRDQGLKLREVCAALEDQGRPGPTGKGWTTPTVHRILKREPVAL